MWLAIALVGMSVTSVVAVGSLAATYWKTLEERQAFIYGLKRLSEVSDGDGWESDFWQQQPSSLSLDLLERRERKKRENHPSSPSSPSSPKNLPTWS